MLQTIYILMSEQIEFSKVANFDMYSLFFDKN